MFWLYNAFLIFSLIIFSPVWLVWLALVPKLRAGFWQKCGCFPASLRQQLAQRTGAKRIWIHAVSVGELNAARPLIKALLAQGDEVVVSTTTATGYALAQKQFQPLPVFFFPFDLPWIIDKTLALVAPQSIVIMETEIWPNLLHRAQQKNIPVVLVNGRLSEKSYQGYLPFKSFFKPVLNSYSALLMQGEADAERIQNLGAPAEKISVCGNIKFDAAPQDDPDRVAQLQVLFNFPPHAKVIVFASTHAGEDELFLALMLRLQKEHPQLCAIFAPRHPERFAAVAALLKLQNLECSLRTDLSPTHPNETTWIVLDTMGELSAVLQLATLTVMGGSFIPWGGHNPLESLRAGTPVLFGPHMANFADIAQKICDAHAGIQVDSIAALENALCHLFVSEDYQQLVENGHQLLLKNRGTVEKIMSTVNQF